VKKIFKCRETLRLAVQNESLWWLSDLTAPDFCSALLQPFLVKGRRSSRVRNCVTMRLQSKKSGRIMWSSERKKGVASPETLGRAWANLFSFDFSEAGTMGLKSLCSKYSAGVFRDAGKFLRKTRGDAALVWLSVFYPRFSQGLR
jgi:hypothetical protein